MNTQTFSTPSPPRKIRPKSELPSNALSTSDILNLYIPTSTEKKLLDSTTMPKTTSSIEYHTSVIQSIEIVKRPLLFNEHDNDTSSRFFSSSSTTKTTTTVTKTSIFDAINENQTKLSVKEETSPSNNHSNKRFKKCNTDQQEEGSQSSQMTVQSSIERFLTPTKESRTVLKIKSPNIENESSTTVPTESDNKQV